MIKANNLHFTYKNMSEESLQGLNLHIRSGELILITGKSGCGKSTLIRTINGLVPHYYEGELSGNVSVCGEDPSAQEIYQTAGNVGSVFQNPKHQFFNVDTTSEIVYGLENLGMKKEMILSRLEETADSLGLDPLLGKSIFDLSGGEKQLIACAGVDALSPPVIVLDEPSSNLDGSAIGRLRNVIEKWKKSGKTVIVCEHRIFYLKGLIDRMIIMESGRIKCETAGDAANAMSIEEAEAAGIRPMALRDYVSMHISERRSNDCAGVRNKSVSGKQYIFEDFRFKYKDSDKGIFINDLTLSSGRIIAIMGTNGAGKSTFARCLTGLEKRCFGRITVNGRKLSAADRIKRSFMVMQDVNLQLFSESVLGEAFLSLYGSKDRRNKRADTRNEEVTDALEKLDIYEYKDRHPLSLSGGQKQRVAIMDAVLSGKEIIVFDEPTSGLDLEHMKDVAMILKKLSDEGLLVLVITHDVELVSLCCDEVLHLEDGMIRDFYKLKDSPADKILELYS